MMSLIQKFSVARQTFTPAIRQITSRSRSSTTSSNSSSIWSDSSVLREDYRQVAERNTGLSDQAKADEARERLNKPGLALASKSKIVDRKAASKALRTIFAHTKLRDEAWSGAPTPIPGDERAKKWPAFVANNKLADAFRNLLYKKDYDVKNNAIAHTTGVTVERFMLPKTPNSEDKQAVLLVAQDTPAILQLKKMADSPSSRDTLPPNALIIRSGSKRVIDTNVKNAEHGILSRVLTALYLKKPPFELLNEDILRPLSAKSQFDLSQTQSTV